MSKMECFVLYFFLVTTTSKLYFHDTKVKTILVFIFNMITFRKLSKFAYTLGRVKVHQILKNCQFLVIFGSKY